VNTIRSVTAALLETPLHNPFVTSQGATSMARAIAVTLEMSDGRTAEGEAVPVKYVTGETVDDVVETVRRVGAELVGTDVRNYRAAFDLIARLAPESPSARCGLEMAVLDAWRQDASVPLHRLWGGGRDSVETDVTIPIVPNAADLTLLAWELGIRVFKLKVGAASLEEDHARVLEIRQAAPEAKLRIDANQAFTPEGALAFVERLVEDGANIQLLEQPVKRDDYDGMHWVAERSPVPVFADESCRTPQDALRLVTSTAVHGLNLKINKCGIAGVLDIIPIARAAGRRLMIGCMLETRRSIAVSLAIACGTGAFEFIDLDSHLLLNESGENPFFQQHGALMAFELPC
jgi:L-alanine-DL-glutamate epimerase-like enolase superfamily enzyme